MWFDIWPIVRLRSAVSGGAANRGLATSGPTAALGLHKNSGFHIDLGRGADLSIEEQQEIAADFLLRHEAALAALKAIPAIETFYLGIQEEVLRHSAGSLFDLHPPLLQAALRIGIQLTVWALLEQKADSD